MEGRRAVETVRFRVLFRLCWESDTLAMLCQAGGVVLYWRDCIRLAGSSISPLDIASDLGVLEWGGQVAHK